MSILKKIGAPLVAVALVASMGVSLLANTGTAHAAVIADAVVAGGTIGTTGNTVWSNNTIATKGVLTANITVSEAATAWAAADTITIAHAGYKLANITLTATGGLSCTWAYAAGTSTCTLAGAGTAGAANDVLTITAADVGLAANATDGAVVAATANGVQTIAVQSLTAKRMMLGNSSTTTFAAPIDSRVPTYSADSAATGGALCAAVADAAGAVAVGIPVTFTVSLGIVSTGTAKSAVVLSTAAGTACTNYRGGGGIATTDTAIASNSSINQVATLSLTLTAPAGNTASKVVINAPTNLAVTADQSNVSPGYISPNVATNFSVQVTDSAGLGVGNQVILVSTDKGALVAGFFALCGTSKAVTATSSATAIAPTPGATALVGVIQLTYCGNQTDAVGKATITASNISTSMANATTTITTAGRPAKVEASYASGTVSATVTDSAGNVVADGTTVQFTISANAGAVSNACTTTTNGKASSAVSLNSGSGSVIVSAAYNESGNVPAGCTAVAFAAPAAGVSFRTGSSAGGAQSVSTVVNIGSVVTPPATGPATNTPAAGAGTFAAAPVYSASKLAQAVFNGGTVAQLESAVTEGKGTGVWAQDSKGVFVLYIVGGGFVNDAFKAAFPTGFAGVTAVTVVGK